MKIEIGFINKNPMEIHVYQETDNLDDEPELMAIYKSISDAVESETKELNVYYKDIKTNITFIKWSKHDGTIIFKTPSSADWDEFIQDSGTADRPFKYVPLNTTEDDSYRYMMKKQDAIDALGI